MKLFGQIIGVVVEVAKLPADVAKDALDIAVGEHPTRTADRLDEIKEAAKEQKKEGG